MKHNMALQPNQNLGYEYLPLFLGVLTETGIVIYCMGHPMFHFLSKELG